jgi:virginiamycin B lyase
MRKAFVLLVLPAVTFLYSASAGAQGRGQQPVQMPEGAGKELVTATCARCHGLNLITQSWGYTKDGWKGLFGTMVMLPSDQAETVATYLATHFPVKPAPEGKVIPGPARVSFKEWQAPTLGQRPHDPMAAKDGSLWWTGQFANRLGRVDTKSGQIREFPLKEGVNAQPHGLTEDRDGNVYYTGIAKNVIGKLNPRTGEVTEYPLNLEGSRGPHTPIIDAKGIVWFSLQSGHVGRLNPANGEMRIVPSPTQPSYPYGMVTDSKGTVWYVDFRNPLLASVDAVTMAFKEYKLPNAESRPRRIAITPDDIVFYTDYSRGYLGRFDTKTGAIKEWLSPGGLQSEPYGIVYSRGAIWYSESGVRPNTLVRFDPRNESFQSWIIPGGGGVVRNMAVFANGDLALAESGVNKVALVEITNPGTN